MNATKPKLNPLPFYVFLCTIPFGEISLCPSFPWLTPTKLAFMFLLAHLAISFGRGWRPMLCPILIRLSALFLVALAFSTVLSSDPRASLIVLMRAAALVLLCLITFWVRVECGLRRLLTTLMVIGVALALFGIGQTLTGQTISGLGEYGYFGRLIRLAGPNGDASVVRAAATFDHPNFLGAFLIAVLPWALIQVTAQRSRVRGGLLSVMVLVLGIGLVFTFSRSAWLGAGAVVAVLALARVCGIRSCIAFALAFLLAILICPDGARTLIGRRASHAQAYDVGRLYSFRTAARMIAAHPFRGVGPGQFHAQYHCYADADEVYPQNPQHHMDAHNTFLDLAAECGLPAAVVFVVLFGVAGVCLWVRCRLPHRVAAPLAPTVAVLAALAALAVQSLFHSLEYQEILWVLIGAAWDTSKSRRFRNDP